MKMAIASCKIIKHKIGEVLPFNLGNKYFSSIAKLR
jgi:hypothetical protein